jgi:hypothetical protein
MNHRDIYSVYQNSGAVPELLYYAFACDRYTMAPAKISTVQCAWRMVQYDLDNNPEVARDCEKVDILRAFKQVLRYVYDREEFTQSEDFIGTMGTLFNACVYRGMHTMDDLIERTECPLSADDVRDKLVVFLPPSIRQHLSPVSANINDEISERKPRRSKSIRTPRRPHH